MHLSKQELGQKAELLAGEFLISNGFQIINRNYRSRFGEIDIIAQIDKTLVFVEVRSKKSLKFGLPDESVSKTKIRKIRMGAERFILAEKLFHLQPRFDLICLEFDPNNNLLDLRHYKNAF